jgi:large subunit ribosomal protein L9
MKVILTTDMDSLGREGEIKEVKNGLARNFLLPKKLAVRATPGNLKIWEQKSGLIQQKQDQQLGEAEGLAHKLQGVTVSIPVKVGEEEKLFGSVTSQNIADELGKQGFEIDKKHIELDSSIKSLGTYDIKVKLYHEVAPSITVHVVDEDNPVPLEEKVEVEVEVVEAIEPVLEEDTEDTQEVEEENS